MGKKIEPKKIICLNTLEEFSSLGKASAKYNIRTSSISSCCNRRIKSAGKLNGTPLVWVFKEEFTKLNNEDIAKMLDHRKRYKKTSKRIICLNNLHIYESISIASFTTGISISSISLCCKGVNRIAGKVDGTKAIWMYYNDYIRLNENTQKSIFNMIKEYKKVGLSKSKKINIMESIFKTRKEALV